MNLKTTLTPAQTGRDSSRHFHAPETARLLELEGLPLATFGQRLLGYAIDLVLAVLLWAPAEACWRIFLLHEHDVHLS
jgi:hypothetical protein